jgi:glycosyltransferase involved in cell wall biosynthesis
LFKSIARRFGKFSPVEVSESTLVSNSDRTASKVEHWYSTRPQVLNPPIDTDGLSGGLPWEEREDGVIFLSRIHSGKNIEWLIEILHQVRQRGHDIHFHIIGPKDTDQPEYYQKIRSLSDEYNFVTMEGKMQGEALNRMLREHKYGINGARTEQFGMAIAEMVTAGMIPFVPNSGGQREIVGENTAVMFETTEEAVEKISEVHSKQDLVPRIKQHFPDIEAKYGKRVFKKEIREIVRRQLQNSC